MYTEPDVNAGFVTRINKDGIDLLADYLHMRVNRFMQNNEIAFNFSAAITSEVRPLYDTFIHEWSEFIKIILSSQ